MIAFLRRIFIISAFRDVRGDVYAALAEESKADSAKRMETVSNTFTEWGKRDRQRKKLVAHAYESVANRLNNSGQSLADAMAPLIPFEERMLITASEQTGRLAVGLQQAIRLKGAVAKMNDEVVGALAQPMASAIMILLTSAVMGIYAWPDVLSQIDAKYWPEWALPSLYFDLWVGRNWPLIGLVAMMVGAYYYTLSRWTGRARQAFDGFFLWSIYRDRVASTFIITLAGFVGNRVLILDAIKAIREKASPYLRWHLTRMIPRLQSMGENSIEAFNTGLLSRQILDQLNDAKRTRNMENTILFIGDQSMDLLVRSVKLRAQFVGGCCVAVFGFQTLYAVAVQVLALNEASEKYVFAQTHKSRSKQ
jgi:hypothetical protein